MLSRLSRKCNISRSTQPGVAHCAVLRRRHRRLTSLLHITYTVRLLQQPAHRSLQHTALTQSLSRFIVSPAVSVSAQCLPSGPCLDSMSPRCLSAQCLPSGLSWFNVSPVVSSSAQCFPGCLRLSSLSPQLSLPRFGVTAAAIITETKERRKSRGTAPEGWVTVRGVTWFWQFRRLVHVSLSGPR